MALNPLEGLMSVAANHQLVSGPVAEPQRQQQQQQQRAAGGPASLHGHGQSREPRKWVQSVCGSRSGSRSGSGSGSGCQSAVQCSTLRGQHSPENAARERSRVRNLRQAFHSLQAALPSVPPDTKLSKLDVLVLATNYIAHLTETLDQGAALAEHVLPSRPGGYLHPVKKWPMRSLLYCGSVGELLSGVQAGQPPPPGRDATHPTPPGRDATHPTPPGRDATHPTPPGRDATHPTPPGRDATHPTPPGRDATHPTPPGRDVTHPTPPTVEAEKE